MRATSILTSLANAGLIRWPPLLPRKHDAHHPHQQVAAHYTGAHLVVLFAQVADALSAADSRRHDNRCCATNVIRATGEQFEEVSRFRHFHDQGASKLFRPIPALNCHMKPVKSFEEPWYPLEPGRPVSYKPETGKLQAASAS